MTKHTYTLHNKPASERQCISALVKEWYTFDEATALLRSELMVEVVSELGDHGIKENRNENQPADSDHHRSSRATP